VKLLIKVNYDYDNKDLRITVIIAKAVLIALVISLLSLTLDFSKITKRDV